MSVRHRPGKNAFGDVAHCPALTKSTMVPAEFPRERMVMPIDKRDGPALELVHMENEPVETLTNEELQAELTVAAHDPVRRKHRYDSLVSEILNRDRAQSAAGV